MTESVQLWWLNQYEDILHRYRGAKLTNGIGLEMAERYEVLDLQEQKKIDAVIIDWVLSDNSMRRSVALYLVKQYNIQLAMPTIKSLDRRLVFKIGNPFTSRHEKAVARNEQEKIHKIMQKLKTRASDFKL